MRLEVEAAFTLPVELAFTLLAPVTVALTLTLPVALPDTLPASKRFALTPGVGPHQSPKGLINALARVVVLVWGTDW